MRELEWDYYKTSSVGTSVLGIGGHLVHYLWSAISDWACMISELLISDWESDIILNIGIKFSWYCISDIPLLRHRHRGLVTVFASYLKGRWLESTEWNNFFFSLMSISEWILMSISEHRTPDIRMTVFSPHIFLWYWNNRCPYRISLTLRSMSMPTYGSGWLGGGGGWSCEL
jgi:hypothetical protein